MPERYRSPESPAEALRRGMAVRSATAEDDQGRAEFTYRVKLSTERELQQWVDDTLGLRIPDQRCCKGHRSPLEAFSASYFAEDAVTVWKGSRGLAGKTVLLAALSLTEAVTLGASVSLLGGSGEQSERVHEYIAGTDPNLPTSFLNAPKAPRHLVRGASTIKRTRLLNGGTLRALLASSKSVRGPHPQRLRLDEVDEMELAIYKAATGQPMDRLDPVSGRLVRSQITVSSTWQYPDGTMQYVLMEAARRGWPVFEWCYKESMKGWLTQEGVDRKRSQVPELTWKVEYDLQEPSPESRAIEPEAIAALCDVDAGSYPGTENVEIIIKKRESGRTYATGTDWAKDLNWTIIETYDVDSDPAELVAWARYGRMPWPLIVKKHEERVRAYPGIAVHDETGVGKVIADYMTIPSIGITLVGKVRTELFSNYILAVEHARMHGPDIEYKRAEHKFLTNDKLFGGGHPPDSVVAGAMVWEGIRQLRGEPTVEETVEEGFVI